MFIKFNNQTNYMGRNGFSKCSGIEILGIKNHLTDEMYLMLSPITSKGKVTDSCNIRIHENDLLSTIKGLIESSNEETRKALKEFINK